MAPLTRANIPMLSAREFKIGTAELAYRSFPIGKKNYFRRFQSEVLDLRIEFEEELESPIVVLSTDINSKRDEWQDLVFEREDSKTFSLRLPLEQCGVFRFKVKYSPDSGETCYWLKGPYSYLLVDPPSMRTVRMYSMIPTVSGHVGDWKELLHHIKSLNFDAVHCLPLTSMDASESPYSAFDLFSIDQSYIDHNDYRLGLDQLEDFVETAKELGLRLCFDLVINHVGITSRLATSRPDWFVQDEKEPDGLKRAGCWHAGDWITWGDLALVNFDHPVPSVREEIRSYMKQYVLFWANYANYTGGMIRYDNLHSSHDAFIYEVTIALRERYPNLLILAEFFTSEDVFIEAVPNWSLNLLQGNSWEYRFVPDLRNYIRHVHEKRDQFKYMFSMTTHDTEMPTKLFASVDSTIPRYMVCALFSTGKTGTVQGVEYGQPSKIDFIGRKPKMEFDRKHDYTEQLTRINSVLGEYTVFQRGGNLEFIDRDHGAVIGGYRFSNLDHHEHEFLLFANLDTSTAHELWVDLNRYGVEWSRLEDLLGSGEVIESKGVHLQVKLEPGGVRAYKIFK